MDERSRRGEKNPSSSRKRWTDHLGDLPTFRKPFEKASTTLAGKAKGGVEGIWAKVKVFDIFLLSRLLQRPRRRRSFSFDCCCEKGGKKLFVEEKRAYSITGKNSVSLSLSLQPRQVQAFKVYLDSHHCRWSILESQWLTFALCYSSRLPI